MVSLQNPLIVRSKRRSIALVIDKHGVLTVRAPYRVPLCFITDFIQDKASWIVKKQKDIQARNIKSYTKVYAKGELFLVLGESYALSIEKAPAITCINKKIIFPERFLNDPSRQMITWYKKLARTVMKERLEFYSNLTGWKYATMKITSATGRWGSCSSSGSINFTWRLVMAPQEVIDYVVVHELVHLVEKNHSVRFWNLVEKIMPEYRSHMVWLREHGHTLTL